MTLSQQIEEIARGTEGYAPDAVLGYPVRTIRALCALALQALDAGQPVATHRHKKRGTEYVLIGFGKMQTENWEQSHPSVGTQSVDMREVAIYRSVDDGSLWVRPREEFEDRFEPLATPSVPADKGEPEVDTIAQLVQALDECEAALKLTECPHPARGRPADDMAEACLDSGNCGCCYGTAFMDIRRARTQQHGAKE